MIAVIKGVPKRANGAERQNAERLARIEADIAYLRLDMDRLFAKLGLFHPVRPMNPPNKKPDEECDT